MLARLLLAGSLLALASAANAATPHYDVAPIPGAPAGYQRVVFTPVVDFANGWGNSSCYAAPMCSLRYYDYLFVTPCPDGKPCGFGHYTKSFPSFASCPNGVPCASDTVDLTIGTTYTIDGNWIIEKYWSGPGSCQDLECSYEEIFATGTYPSNTPTVPTRWGTLRVKYR